MKKKTAVCAVVMGLAMAMTGCSSGTVSNEYITITKYKEVEVPKVEGLPDITDEAVENNIQKVLEGFAQTTEITDRPAQEGDIVVVDYTASVNGEVLEDGEVSDYPVTIGEGALYEGFDDAIAGHSVGDVFETEHKFAEDDTTTSLAGQLVTLKITVKSITEKELPDLTDEFVQTISQKSETVEEYKKEMRELLEENNEEYALTELTESSWEKVLENTEVKKYPEDELEEEKQSFYDHYEKGAEAYGMEFEEFLESMDMTEDEFAEKVEEAAKSNVKENLVVALIAEKENIELSDEEYEKAKEDLAKEMSYESVEEMEEEAPEDAIRKYIMRDKVKEWVAKNCIQVKE